MRQLYMKNAEHDKMFSRDPCRLREQSFWCVENDYVIATFIFFFSFSVSHETVCRIVKHDSKIIRRRSQMISVQIARDA